MYPPPWPSCKLFICVHWLLSFQGTNPVQSWRECDLHLLEPSISAQCSPVHHFQNWFNIYKVTIIDENILYVTSCKIQQNNNFHPQSIAAQVLGILVAFTCCRLTLGLQAFRHVFWNQFNHRNFQMVIWSTTEIIFPVHCIYTIFSGLVSRDIRASTWWIDISRIKFQYL